jgi:lysophospholipase L1-like esterase
MNCESSIKYFDSKEYKLISVNAAEVCLAPYVWKRTQVAGLAAIEAAMPGAYLKFMAENTRSVGIIVDVTAAKGCPASSMPVIEYSVDNGPFKVLQLTVTGDVYMLMLAEKLDHNRPHHVELYFRAADLMQKRWETSTVHLCLAGIALDHSARLVPVPVRPRKAIGFGDSIIEGVGVEGRFTSWQGLEVNRAAGSWFPLVCAALGCEYGQLGTGGQGILNKSMEIPPLLQTWDHYDAYTSRLTDNLLLPEPDYVFCGMGTNDFQDRDPKKPCDISDAYLQWLTAVRKACPTADIFCVVPPFGWHFKEIQTAVTVRNQAGDRSVYLIDTAPLKDGFDPENQPSRYAYDGCHPSLYGNAMLASLITAEVQKINSSPTKYLKR